MQVVGQTLRAADVRAIYLVHGSFVGADAFGLFRDVARVSHAAAEPLRLLQKQLLDALANDAGNYTIEFAKAFEEALSSDAEQGPAVRLFNWSSENNHIGRADGAIRLLAEMLADESLVSGRVVVWAHSHGGNVLALMTNLLGGDARSRRRFFHATRPYYRWPALGGVDLPDWPRVQKMLDNRLPSQRTVRLDLVTFGTPVRYGWDTNGYNTLTHFINHRPVPGKDAAEAMFPNTADDLFRAKYGDYIQQFGIAGTNFAPAAWSWRTSLADVRLGRLLQPGLRKRDLLSRLKIGTRAHDEGTNLLVDYGIPQGHVGQHLAGHAVYTRLDWLLFHAEEVACRLFT
jgi:hypothetical protein